MAFLVIFFQDNSDEIERLRREVQKYRLEISNRDANFNRMFTEKQRVHVDPRAGKIGQQQNSALRPFSPGQLLSASSKGRMLSYTNTEVTLVYIMCTAITYYFVA